MYAYTLAPIAFEGHLRHRQYYKAPPQYGNLCNLTCYVLPKVCWIIKSPLCRCCYSFMVNREEVGGVCELVRIHPQLP